jgi:hypothetical protein
MVNALAFGIQHFSVTAFSVTAFQRDSISA